MVEALNLSTLKDLQTEIQQKTDLLDLVATLSDQISREKKDITVSKSGMKERGGQEAYELRKRIEELQARVRELEDNRQSRKEQVNRVRL